MSDPRSRPATPIDTNSSETYFYSHYLCWQSLPCAFFFRKSRQICEVHSSMLYEFHTTIRFDL